MANSADPDQLASSAPTDLDLHCLQREGISRFSRTRVNQTLLVGIKLLNLQVSTLEFTECYPGLLQMN